MSDDHHPPRTIRTLFESRYRTIRRMAAARLRREGDISMSPSSLAHEAYKRLWRSARSDRWSSAPAFLGSIRNAMTWVLGDYWRARRSKKRDHERSPIDVDTTIGVYLFDLPEERWRDALSHVAAQAPRGPQLCKVLTLLHEEGFSPDDVAATIGCSTRKVYRDASAGKKLVTDYIRGNDIHQ